MRNKSIKMLLETDIGGVNFFLYPLVDNILFETYSFLVIDQIGILGQRRRLNLFYEKFQNPSYSVPINSWGH